MNRKFILINQILALLFSVFIMFNGSITFVYAASADTNQHRVVAVPDKPIARKEIVVLIHGLIRTTWSMYPIKSYLEKQGYHVYSYSYPSARYTIKQHGVYLNQFINNLLAKNPDAKIDFITHSMGGIITREALSKMTTKQLNHIGCLVMLAPPNQGSKLAKLSTTIFPMFTAPIKPLAELSSDGASYVHRVPIPHIKMGIIAGRYDAKVPPDSARLNGDVELAVVNSTHTFIMNKSETKKLITSFLEKGTFR